MRRNGSLFHVIYNNGYEAHDHNLINISFNGGWKEFSLIVKGKCVSREVLKLEQDRVVASFKFNEKKTNDFDTFIATNSENNNVTYMNFSMMESLIKLLMLSGYEVIV